MKEKLDIAFIGTPDYPIPAIHGGAIQTLVTALIDKNEENPKFNITIYTIISFCFLRIYWFNHFTFSC